MATRPIQNHETRSFRYGTALISYDLIRTNAGQLKIKVHPDLRVEVFAPDGKTGEEVDRRVIRKAAWIIRQQHYFEQFLPVEPERRYVSGETHYYLGRQYRLKVSVSSKEKSVRLIGRFLIIDTPDRKDREAIRKQVDGWYRDRARNIFNAHALRCYERIRRYGIDLPKMSIKKMEKRWGSLTPSGNIILNLALVKAPLQCIDYVLVHELCHTKHQHHGPKFEALLTKCMPEWKRVKERLEKVDPGQSL